VAVGLYFRKSVNAGPFRVNFSKSGVGGSVGVHGFRVGSGPRGTYVHVGAHAVYYRRVLSSRSRARAVPDPSAAPLRFGAADMVDMTGGDASRLLPTGPGELIEQLRAASRYQMLLPWAAIALMMTIGVAAMSKVLWVPISALVVGAPALVWLWWWERGKRTATAVYEVSGPVADWFAAFCEGHRAMVVLGGAWRVEASAAIVGTYGYKVSGGADAAVERKPIARGMKAPRVLTTNIAVPTISHDRQALLFLPDRILVRSFDDWSDVDYQYVRVTCTRQRVIEYEQPPRDGTQVDTTWQFVNVRGGPDRRYRHNPQLPIMEYGHLTLTTPNGLSWVIDCSRPEVAERFAAALSSRPR